MCFYPSDQQRIKRQYPEFSRATGISNTGRWLIQKYMSYQKSKAWSDNLMLKNSPEKIACNWDLKLSMSKPKLLYLKKKPHLSSHFLPILLNYVTRYLIAPQRNLVNFATFFPSVYTFPLNSTSKSILNLFSFLFIVHSTIEAAIRFFYVFL